MWECIWNNLHLPNACTIGTVLWHFSDIQIVSFPHFQVLANQGLFRSFSKIAGLNVSCIWAASWQNQQNGMCAQRRLRSAWASAQSDQSLHCPHEESLGPLNAQRRLWSDWANAQAYLSLRWCTVILLVLSWGGSFSFDLRKGTIVLCDFCFVLLDFLSLETTLGHVWPWWQVWSDLRIYEPVNTNKVMISWRTDKVGTSW